MFFTEGTFTKMSPEEEGNIEIQQVLTYTLPENGIIYIEIPIYPDTVHLKIKVKIMIVS